MIHSLLRGVRSERGIDLTTETSFAQADIGSTPLRSAVYNKRIDPPRR